MRSSSSHCSPTAHSALGKQVTMQAQHKLQALTPSAQLHAQDYDEEQEVLSLSYIPDSDNAFFVTLSGRWAGHVWQGSFQDSNEVGGADAFKPSACCIPGKSKSAWLLHQLAWQLQRALLSPACTHPACRCAHLPATRRPLHEASLANTLLQALEAGLALCTHTNTHTHTHARARLCTQTHILARRQMHIHIHTHAHVRARTFTHTCTYASVHICSRSHMYERTYACTHTHTHTQILMQAPTHTHVHVDPLLHYLL